MKTLTRQVLLGFCAVLAAGFVAMQGPATPPRSADAAIERPFGTLREQAVLQQEWLRKRLDMFLPGLMRRHKIDLWVVPMREYAEDPVFVALTQTGQVVSGSLAVNGRLDTAPEQSHRPERLEGAHED
jgi:hypothetical protein